jgi:hypothetical protein
MLTKQAILAKISQRRTAVSADEKEARQALADAPNHVEPSIRTPKPEKRTHEPAKRQESVVTSPVFTPKLIAVIPAVAHTPPGSIRPNVSDCHFLRGIDPNSLTGKQLSSAESIADGAVFLASLPGRYVSESLAIHATASRHLAALRSMTGHAAQRD